MWDVLRLIRRCFTENNNGQHLSASLVLGRLYTPLTQFNCLGWNLSGTERFIRLGLQVKTWQLRCRQERESSDVTSNQSEAAPQVFERFTECHLGVSLIAIPAIALAKTANLLSMSARLLTSRVLAVTTASRHSKYSDWESYLLPTQWCITMGSDVGYSVTFTGPGERQGHLIDSVTTIKDRRTKDEVRTRGGQVWRIITPVFKPRVLYSQEFQTGSCFPLHCNSCVKLASSHCRHISS